ncbi:HutD/Ves family protein [Asticcacaulis sp.]|uniref:HutD/Ves family protein n=1 Tax=Asticcacaulis sp. TaxID=1872648 RepID=UPI003F7CD072
MIIHLPALQRIPQPWKNGGGVTREIAVFPDGAGMDDFQWRISMAEVTESGPFSRFDSIDRHLTVLSGRLQIDLPDRRQVLNPGDSLAFEGDIPVHATPLLPVIDLNVMTRRGQAHAEVRHIASGVILPSDLVFLVATKPMIVTANGQRYALQPYDALRFEGLEGEPISSGDGYLIAF